MLRSTVPVTILRKCDVKAGNNGKIFIKVNSSQLLYNEKRKGKISNKPLLSLYNFSILLFIINLSLFK